MREKYRSIARVERSHGKKGEVVTVPVHGLPLLVCEGLEVCVVPPELNESRWHRVMSCSDDPSRSGQLVRLSGVATIGQAETLVGKTLLARESDLPENFALLDAERLIGREVHDQTTGGSGVIEEVLRGPANDVWVLEGDRGELLVPVIDEVVGEVSPEGVIEVCVPFGLVWEGGSDEDGDTTC